MGATIRDRGARGWFVHVHRHGRRTAIACGHGEAGREKAQDVADEIRRQHEDEDAWLQTPSPEVAQALRGWLAVERPSLSRSYEATASALIEHHLVPGLGGLRLAHLDRGHLLGFVEWTLAGDPQAKRKPRSRATALNALSLLRRVCQLHVEAGILASNPCSRVGSLVSQVARRHEPEVRRADAWTREEVAKLLELARRHERWVYGPLLCALHTGMRRGEVLGLEWPDVGPERVVVGRALVRGRTKAPKSGKAREVPISGTLRAHLDELRAELRTRRAWRDAGPVFLAPSGERWDEGNFGRAWRRLMKRAVKAGVRPLRFHDARHTFASWALEGGRSIRWIQEVLGHSSAELTLRTYAHLMPREGDELGFLDGCAEEATGAQPDATTDAQETA